MTATILDGREVARHIQAELQEEIDSLKARPQLRVLYFDTQISRIYWQAQNNAAKSLCIGTTRSVSYVSRWETGSFECPWKTVSQEEVEQIIEWWNRDPEVHGIFVHQPLPPQLNAQRISALIDPRKDVEGIHPQNSARRFFAKARIGSCTALAVMRLIEETGEPIEGKEAVVVGHSEIVGRPVSMLLLDQLATTTICHIGTRSLEEHVTRADILVVAAGKPKLIKGQWVKPGSIVIDVGINVENGKVVGDVEFAVAKDRAKYITQVPGGVGPVTVMMVMKNTLEAFKLQAGDQGTGVSG